MLLVCCVLPGHYSRTWPVGDCKSCDGEYATCDGGLAQPFPDRYYWTNPVADGVFRLVSMQFHDDKAALGRQLRGGALIDPRRLSWVKLSASCAGASNNGRL